MAMCFPSPESGPHPEPRSCSHWTMFSHVCTTLDLSERLNHYASFQESHYICVIISLELINILAVSCLQHPILLNTD